jgi:hypothetical protein
VLVSCLALCVAMVLGTGGAPVAAHVAAPALPALRPAAILTVISGDVLTRFGGMSFASAADGAVLYVGSAVRTAYGARAVITLFEGSTVELEPGSEVMIEEATTRSDATIVQLAQSLGRSWHVVTRLTNADSRYEVRTPSATASVRGTAFEVVVTDGATGPTTTVTTTEGLVATLDTAATREVLVAPAQTTTVRANAAPESPRSAPEAQRVVTVSAASESSLVVDPLGRANGFKDGRVIAQSPGASVRMDNGTIVVTLLNAPDGVFTTTVAAAAGAATSVSTTVTERGEEPVTITNTVDPGSTTSAVELRTSGGKPVLRALDADERKALSDAKAGAWPAKPENGRANPTAQPQAGATTPLILRATALPVQKTDATPRPAVPPRRAPVPSPAPTRR